MFTNSRLIRFAVVCFPFFFGWALVGFSSEANLVTQDLRERVVALEARNLQGFAMAVVSLLVTAVGLFLAFLFFKDRHEHIVQLIDKKIEEERKTRMVANRARSFVAMAYATARLSFRDGNPFNDEPPEAVVINVEMMEETIERAQNALDTLKPQKADLAKEHAVAINNLVHYLSKASQDIRMRNLYSSQAFELWSELSKLESFRQTVEMMRTYVETGLGFYDEWRMKKLERRQPMEFYYHLSHILDLADKQNSSKSTLDRKTNERLRTMLQKFLNHAVR